VDLRDLKSARRTISNYPEFAFVDPRDGAKGGKIGGRVLGSRMAPTTDMNGRESEKLVVDLEVATWAPGFEPQYDPSRPAQAAAEGTRYFCGIVVKDSRGETVKMTDHRPKAFAQRRRPEKGERITVWLKTGQIDAVIAALEAADTGLLDDGHFVIEHTGGVAKTIKRDGKSEEVIAGTYVATYRPPMGGMSMEEIAGAPAPTPTPAPAPAASAPAPAPAADFADF
jgi:hypothetical protein